jgi:hypothetical protein
MPTYGWVREDALEAFLEGTERVPERAAAAPPVLVCPFCSKALITARQLQDHIASDHRIERPVLLVDGMEPVKDQVIRVRYRPADFVVTNVTDVALTVDGKEQSVDSFDEVARELAELRQGNVALNLANGNERMAAATSSSSASPRAGRCNSSTALLWQQWLTATYRCHWLTFSSPTRAATATARRGTTLRRWRSMSWASWSKNVPMAR